MEISTYFTCYIFNITTPDWIFGDERLDFLKEA